MYKQRMVDTAEAKRLAENEARTRYWKRWGPYLSERQWGTVREDYSAEGTAWFDLPHDHARSRAYRWGEDGLLGSTDRRCRLCFALALWNGRDAILKERLFGLTGPEGNHGEDVKELYYYLDATPTYSYARSLYKYPQAAFPYAELAGENRRRDKRSREFELLDTGVFDDGRYFDVVASYAKGGPNDVAIRLTVHNRGPEDATLHLLPQLWFRNTWSWGREGDGYWPMGRMAAVGDPLAGGAIEAVHPSTLGSMRLVLDPPTEALAAPAEVLFTDNETNTERLFGSGGPRYAKDAFHRRVIYGETDACRPTPEGTKAAFWLPLRVPAAGEVSVRLRLVSSDAPAARDGAAFADHDQIFADRQSEADRFYAGVIDERLSIDERRVARQAYAGLLHTNQFYHFAVKDWLAGDPAQPAPAPQRERGRNREWDHLFANDVLSMPDKWEYPWFAAWDLAFHMIPYARLDREFAKRQLLVFLREWYMHPNGQIPAYEFAFGDVNPPVHAWAVWRVYELAGDKDVDFLARCFQKLLLNFTWWVNRKDLDGDNVFSGGFLGLDNIGVFDRSKPLPTGGQLDQADGTAWMAFYCGTMLTMALELARHDRVYGDMASKFFEHFVEIVDAMNDFEGRGLWDEEDGFYYDHLRANGHTEPLRTRSLVGLAPLFAVTVLEDDLVAQLPGFKKRMQWFLDNRSDLASSVSYMARPTGACRHGHRLLAVPSRERLVRVLQTMLDESEFLSPHGIRSLSRVHRDAPYVFRAGDGEHRVAYTPAEADTYMFGGNSNWRGPIWFPLNFLLLEALETYHHFFGDDLTVEMPTGSGRRVTLDVAAREIAARLTRLFVPDASGRRPAHGGDARYAQDPHFKDLVLFYEYFDGDDGRGCGASHQTGWTALVASCLDKVARGR